VVGASFGTPFHGWAMETMRRSCPRPLAWWAAPLGLQEIADTKTQELAKMQVSAAADPSRRHLYRQAVIYASR